MEKLFIISNESFFLEGEKYFCDNIDMKTTPEGLSTSFEINIIARKSKKSRSHKIELREVNVSSTFFNFLLQVFKSIKYKEAKYLIISITPYTFFACIFLKLFNKKILVFLRSDGYAEYKAIFGFIGPKIYHFMFSTISKISNFISVREYILKGKKGSIVSPSQLDDIWLENTKHANLDSIKLLYVGRLKVEKGIFSLLDIIKDNDKINLTIVGIEKEAKHNIYQDNTHFYEIESNQLNLIKHYDNNNIFVLPSFTEGYPMVLLEALSRLRPTIVFKDISHVIGNKIGIFVSERNSESFNKTLNHIIKNYNFIQQEMKKNKLPTKKQYIKSFIEVINSN
jgi:glycosyltransferase involved in cell wall biosynthesis|tara:strand:+ start:864 stop:1880 length:1017 start_codon:yes stop_codon:yes gene_type:complete